MKYSTIIIFLQIGFAGALFATKISAQTLQDTRVTLSVKDVSLKAILQNLEQQSTFSINYTEHAVSPHSTLSFAAQNQPLDITLKKLLQPLSLEYTLVGRSIIIKPQAVVSAGSIQGTVKDAASGEFLIGANVLVEGLGIGGSVDVKGNFLLPNVPEGEHVLVVSFIGYETQKIQGVRVIAGNSTTLAVALSPSAESLTEIVILGDNVRYKPIQNSTEASMVSEMHDADLIITGISNEQIRKSLDRDASDIIKRVSSATIINDRFVLLRGLDPRYTQTMLNGFIAPSAETDTRDFSFDLIPSNVIDRITIYKSPVPELPADYIGGVVNIVTKNSSTARQVQLQLSAQYRTGTTFENRYTYEGSKTDWLGYDHSVRPLPKSFPDEFDHPSIRDGVENSTYDGRALWEASQKKSWSLQQRNTALDKRALINYYDYWRMGRARLNTLSSLGYTTTFQNLYTEGAYIPFGNLINYRKDSLSTEGVRISGMQNFKLILSDNHAIEFNNVLNQMSDDNTLVRYRNGKGGDFQNAAFAKVQELRFRSRFLYAGQLAGHYTPGKLAVHWRLGYSATREQLPNYRGVAHGRRLNNDSLAFFGGFNEFFRVPFAFWHDLKEKNYTAATDVEIPLVAKLTLKTGVYAELKKRTFDSRRFHVVANGQVPGSAFYQAGDYLTPDKFRGALDPSYEKFTYMDAFLNTAYSIPGYRAENRQLASYIALSIPLFQEKVNVYGGVRMEFNNQKLWAPPLMPFNETQHREILRRDSAGVDWLPSVNLTYHINAKMQLRAGYGFTVNRPVFREVADWSFYEQSTNTALYGNLVLYQARAVNTDLRWEWYLSDRELISVGAYYKYIVDPIERYANTSDLGASNIFINSRDAKALGVEIEVRKDFGFLGAHKFFKELSVISNVSFIHTEVRAARNVIGDLSFLIPEGKFIPTSKEVRPLVGSSPYIVNLGLYYDNAARGTQLSLLYNVAGQRLIVAGSASSVGEVYELPRHVIDFVYTQRVTSFLSVKMGVQDLLNQAFRFYRDVNRNEKYDNQGYELTKLAIAEGDIIGPNDLNTRINLIPDVETIDYLESTYKPGSYFNFGLNFTF